MELESIKLTGNRRFQLAGINEIDYQPKAKQQLILGTNGSGKSTLLNLLSPLPPSPSEYIKGGSQETVWVKSDGTRFKLRSSFARGEHPHSFIKDGVELNEGGTLMIQRKLVEMHFNYTTDLHELLIGNVKFTSLPPQKRKEWLVKLCFVDVSYAISVYSKLQVTARNVLGAKKHTEQRIVQRSAQLLGTTELADLKQRIESLTSEIQILTEAKDYTVQWTEQHATELRFLQAQLIELSMDVLSIPTLELQGFRSTTDVQNAIEKTYQDIAAIQAKNEGIKKEFNSISDVVKMISQSSTVSLPALQAEKAELQQQLESMHLTLQQQGLVSRNDLRDLQQDLEMVIDPIEDILTEIPLNADMKLYNTAVFNQKQEERAAIMSGRDSLRNRLESAERRIAYLKSHDPVNCPKCTHTWVPGVSPEEIARLEGGLPKAHAKLEDFDKQLKVIDEYFEAAQEWKNIYLRYTNYVSQYPRLKNVWDYYLDDKRLFNEPRQLVGFIRQYYQDLLVAIHARTRRDRIDVLEAAITERQLLEGNNVQALNGKLAQLDEELSVGMAEHKVLTSRAESLQQLYDTIRTLENRSRSIRELLNHFLEGLAKQLRHGANSKLDALLQTRQQSMASLSTRYHDASSDVAMLEQYERDLDDLKRSENDLKLTLDALSPTSGIIAQTLNSFIGVFTEGLNKVISQIWTTPLAVLPCSMKDSDLDYRFPLWLGSDEKTTDDIANGSTGQKEIVDFAFLLVARSFLHFNQHPLILDEVGRTFTDTHRRHLFDFIKLLPSQIFIVSHFSNTHGALNQADVNFIDPTGILIREGYNKHFKLA